jgi:hypothetical protein
MNETLTADKGKVLEAYNKAKSPRKVMLENLFGIKTFHPDVKARIKTFDDVLAELQITPRDFAQQCTGLSADEIAYRKVKYIVQVFNEGWTPDWSNSNEYKYVPYFKMGSPPGGGFSCGACGFWGTASNVGSRLCFKSSDLAKHAGKLFETIYKDFLTL